MGSWVADGIANYCNWPHCCCCALTHDTRKLHWLLEHTDVCTRLLRHIAFSPASHLAHNLSGIRRIHYLWNTLDNGLISKQIQSVINLLPLHNGASCRKYVENFLSFYLVILEKSSIFAAKLAAFAAFNQLSKWGVVCSLSYIVIHYVFRNR